MNFSRAEAGSARLPRPEGWAIVAVLAATELLLCRITDGPLPPSDVVAALVFAALLAALAEGLRRTGRTGHAVGIGLVVTLYGLALLLPIVVGRTSWVLVPGLVVLASLVFIVGPMLRTGVLAPRVVVGLYGLHALTAWSILSLQIGPPELRTWISLAGAFVLVLALGRLAPLVALVALVPGGAPSFEPPATQPGQGPDILLISIDTLRADTAKRMRAYQWMAESGVALAGQAPSPWTLPSLATLMTGTDPHHHHAVRGKAAFGSIATGVTTLAQRLQAAGWDTALTAENPFAGAQFGLHRGFRHVDHESDRAWVLPQAPYAACARPVGGTFAAWLGLARETPYGIDRRLETARGFLAARSDHPLFLWIHVLDPHLPYSHAWGLDSLPLWRRASLAHTNREAIGEAPTQETLEILKQAYEHEVAVVDAALLEFLSQLPPAPKGRIIVLTSDHGEAFGEHGGWEHGHSMYQELLAVPLVIQGIDGIAEGRLAGLVDVAPTLLRAAGLDDTGLDGRSLQSAGLSRVTRDSVNPLYGSLDLRAQRVGDRKLIAQGTSVLEYNLARDPTEAKPEPRPIAEVASSLPPIPLLENGVHLEPETEQSLRALGYLEDLHE